MRPVIYGQAAAGQAAQEGSTARRGRHRRGGRAAPTVRTPIAAPAAPACADRSNLRVKVLVADPDEATSNTPSRLPRRVRLLRSVLTSGPDDTRRAIDDDEPDVILVGTGIAETDIGSVCRLVRDRESGGYRYVIALVDPADTESLEMGHAQRR